METADREKARAKSMGKSVMDGAELKARIKAAGLNQDKFAALCGVTKQSVSWWVNNVKPVPQYALTIIEQHEKLHQ